MTRYMTQMDFVKDFVAVANIFRPLRIFVRESAIQKESRYPTRYMYIHIVSHRVTGRCRWRLKTPLPAYSRENYDSYIQAWRGEPAGSAVRSAPCWLYARWLQKWIGDFLNVESPFPRDVESRTSYRRLSLYLIDVVPRKRRREIENGTSTMDEVFQESRALTRIRQLSISH